MSDMLIFTQLITSTAVSTVVFQVHPGQPVLSISFLHLFWKSTFADNKGRFILSVFVRGIHGRVSTLSTTTGRRDDLNT